jgi:Putative restriction endonuclease
MKEKHAMHDGFAGSGYGAPASGDSWAAERMDCPGGDRSGAGSRAAGLAPDEHLVEPETRWEVIQGARIQASPARPPHADRHFTMDYVLGGHLAAGYVGATDLLTRWSSEDDYATDTSVRRAGLDQATGERHLEEMAFEVAYTQRRAELEARARLLAERGVRRIFAVFVKDGTVEEWSREAGIWQALIPGTNIEDACLAEPVPVRALLDAAAADEAVARALVARRHPVITEFGHSQKLEAKLGSLRIALEERGLEPDAQQRVRIEACTDLDTLDRWLRWAMTATDINAIFFDLDGDED